ncbi:hypothetical protein 2 [Hubei tombus-like virus 36]|uniref:hypothetical protein 2 n=1 Tax=Hubei tombus-like virus 36 TaxID=1923284 RepID=UPI000909A4FB|nr:hypothetical protein 2 [Hubei tombus-like virus 36]APG76457.1 hypothetical protein 2 [Hubei tombus-like virus 36]
MRSGVRKRFAIKTPTPKPGKLDRLGEFVDKWLQQNLTPLAPDSDTTVEHWLSQTNYPAYRRAELLDKNDKITNDMDTKLFRVKSFMKDECYPEYKHARAINSRTDEFKTLVGPTFKLIEKELFELPWFIKKIPVKDRPNYIMERLYRPNGKYYATDYTAFEAHFTKPVMDACENRLYKYMTQHLPNHKKFMWYIDNVIGGRNVCDFKHLTVEIDATRMSGEMNTSLGNGFSNLMLFLFMAHEKGCTNVTGVVEGDDGLFVLEGPGITEEDAKECGFFLKIESHLSIATASFCGIIFDEEDRNNLTNPLAELVNFGWTTGQYARSKRARHLELLRSKALSLFYQYPGCPVLSSLANYALRCTIGYKAKLKFFRNMWEREQFIEALKFKDEAIVRPVGNGSRLLVEELFGLSVTDQLRTEAYLDSLDTIQELDMPWLEWNYHKHWKHYADNYLAYTDGRFKADYKERHEMSIHSWTFTRAC